MRLIDADYGQKQLTIAEVECGKNFETDCNHVRDFLNAMPTIDAVLVVRCRECKYRGTDDCIFHIKGEPADEELLLKLDNDFCSYGERKEGADNG